MSTFKVIGNCAWVAPVAGAGSRLQRAIGTLAVWAVFAGPVESAAIPERIGKELAERVLADQSDGQQSESESNHYYLKSVETALASPEPVKS